MAERTTGLHKIVTIPAVYTAIQNILAGKGAKERIARQIFSGLDNQRVVEIGCGPGLWSSHLQHASSYIGVDRNARHIQAATALYGNAKTHFLCGDLATTGMIEQIGQCDAVVAIGILHHLDDDICREVLKHSASLLRQNGVFIGLEPVYHAGQNVIAKILKNLDSGKNIRNESRYRELFDSGINVETKIITNFMRVPYSHIVIKGVLR